MFGIGVLGKILGSEKAFGKVFDAAKGAIDKAVYTRQEKAENSAKLELMRFEQRAKLADQAVKWMEATSSQNLARRVLALLIAGIWAIAYMLSLGLVVWSTFEDPSDAAQLRTAAVMIDDHISDVEGWMLLVLGFYFTTPMTSGIVDALVKRNTDKKESRLVSELKDREVSRILDAADRPAVDEAEIERRVQQGVDERVKEERKKAAKETKPKPSTFRNNPARDRLLGLS